MYNLYSIINRHFCNWWCLRQGWANPDGNSCRATIGWQVLMMIMISMVLVIELLLMFMFLATINSYDIVAVVIDA